MASKNTLKGSIVFYLFLDDQLPHSRDFPEATSSESDPWEMHRRAGSEVMRKSLSLFSSQSMEHVSYKSVDYVGKLSVILITLIDALRFIRVNVQRKLKTVQLRAGG